MCNGSLRLGTGYFPGQACPTCIFCCSSLIFRCFHLALQAIFELVAFCLRLLLVRTRSCRFSPAASRLPLLAAYLIREVGGALQKALRAVNVIWCFVFSAFAFDIFVCIQQIESEASIEFSYATANRRQARRRQSGKAKKQRKAKPATGKRITKWIRSSVEPGSIQVEYHIQFRV